LRNGIYDYPNPFTKKGKEFLKELSLPEIDKILLESNLNRQDKRGNKENRQNNPGKSKGR